MHCHCGTNNRAPRWTFTDPCKPEVRPGAREESASPAWLATPAMNARDTTKVYIWRLDTGCGPTLYRKCHSHNTPGKRYRKLSLKSSNSKCFKAKRSTKGCSKFKSGNKTSSGDLGSDVRTHSSPKVGQDQVSGGVSVLCWYAAPVEYVLWKPGSIR